MASPFRMDATEGCKPCATVHGLQHNPMHVLVYSKVRPIGFKGAYSLENMFSVMREREF